MSASSKIVLASNNSGKLREMQHYLAASSLEIIPQSQFAVPEIAETGLSFVENALLKARHAASHTHLPTIADDSGLVVDALNGAPGIYSARYAGANASDADNNQKLLQALINIPEQQRVAHFVCVLVYLKHASDPMPLIYQGVWTGRILLQAQGKNGFGYDPLFYVPSNNCSAAELPLEIKNQISHRGQAMRQFVAMCRPEDDNFVKEVYL